LAAIQAAASVTQRIELGTAVVPTYLFHPLALARSAATVHDASGGRLTLGIGPSQPTVIEAMHGIPFTKPALHTREYLEILRSAMSGAARVEHGGELYQVASMFGVPSDHDKAEMPILVGALGAVDVAGGRRTRRWHDRDVVRRRCDRADHRSGRDRAAAAAGRRAPRVRYRAGHLRHRRRWPRCRPASR
jgi:alkanesulfonate monooxygenase SsuD/methylene tetrahydromethanopterin reductase-like flavin-dependent oxidoreductase (luciferase family)